jgi:hypothetical protein
LRRQQQEALNEQLLAKINIEDLSDEELANLNIEDVLEAVSSSSSSAAPKIVFPAKNLFDNVAATATPTASSTAADSPRTSLITIFKSGDRPGEFTSLVSTVFLDGSSSSSASSSSAAKEKRFRRSAGDAAIPAAAALRMTHSQAVQATQLPTWTEEALTEYQENAVEAVLGAPRGPVHVQLDSSSDLFLQSGLVTEAETFTSSIYSSVLPTILFSP